MFLKVACYYGGLQIRRDAWRGGKSARTWMMQRVNAEPLTMPIEVLIKQKKPLKISDFSNGRVELEGIEPSSAQGNHTLSTCLFQPSIFEVWQDLDHQSYPYPLKFHPCNEAYMNYFRFACTAWSTRFGTTSVERCPVPAPCAGIKLIYCTSIKQRERSYFRQLIFCSLGFRR